MFNFFYTSVLVPSATVNRSSTRIVNTKKSYSIITIYKHFFVYLDSAQQSAEGRKYYVLGLVYERTSLSARVETDTVYEWRAQTVAYHGRNNIEQWASQETGSNPRDGLLAYISPSRTLRQVLVSRDSRFMQQ